jgi:glycine rich protein/type IX secretion system substrate protein/Big-like domain-containing protein
MKRFYLSRLVILVALLTGWNWSAIAQTTIFSVPGTYSYTVAAGVSSVSIDMAGGSGGTDYYNYGKAGLGGRMQCQLAVTGGQVLSINVGGSGQPGFTCCSGTALGGFNGGGQVNYYPAGAGGGASDIRLGGVALSNRIIVAGGGGGAGDDCSSGNDGGNGGGLSGVGGNSCSSYSTCYSGGGGTQNTAGNGAGCYGSTGAGVNNLGGSWPCCYYGAGGGGGGYFGGGAGVDGGGGGGSSYPAASGGIISGLINLQGIRSGNGYVSIIGPTLTVYPSTLAFGYVPVGTSSAPQSIQISGVNLSTSPCVVTAPSGYLVSLDGVTWTSSVNIIFTPPTLPVTDVFVQFNPTVAVSYCSFPLNIASGTTGATVPVCGAGAGACSGTPTAGAAVVTPTTGGSGTAFTLSLSGSSASSGVTYQWQSGASGVGPWTNIAGAITYQYSFIGITANTFYRCVVTCAGGGSANSASASATFSPALQAFAKPCSGTPLSGIVYSPITAGCAAYSANVYDIGATVDSGVTHQWQSSTDGLSWGPVGGANSAIITQSISGTIYYRDLVTCTIGTPASSTSSTIQLVLNTPPNPISGIQNICTANPVTMTETTSGGTWSTLNPAIASVGTSGIVTGTGAGTTTVSYTLGTGCNATINVTVNTSPSAITGPASVCTSQTIALTDATGGGVWSSSNTFNATVGTSGTTTGITGSTTPNISYTLPSGCSSYQTVSVNTLPAPITGVTSVCVGNTTLVGDLKSGGTWVSSNSFHASIDALTGLITGIVASGNTITYTLPGGCFVTTPITVNPLPAAISGAANVCVGSNVTLSDAGSGTWTSQYPSVASIIPGSGVMTGVAAGTTTVTYILNGTGCAITSVENVAGKPAVFAVTGGGGYCTGGSGAHVGLSGSAIGVSYQLYLGSTPLPPPVPGSSSGLDFGLMTGVGTYTVQATDATYGCASNMSGSTSITLNSLPNVYNLSAAGSGSYCAGGAGVMLQLSGSDVGVGYQVMNGLVPVGLPVPGTGAGVLNLGFQTVAANYTVVATNTSTLCTANMTGVASVTVSTPPSVYTLMSGGVTSYCVGGTGVDITLSGSAVGVNYTLYKGGVPVNTLVGTGSALDFNTQPIGCYTCVAVDATSLCTSNMTGTICLTTNPLPVAETVTGGGGFCAGGTGVHVGLSYSAIGTTYQLLPGGPTKAGSNSGLDFGLQTTGGTYTVQATNGFGCTLMMTGSVTVTPNPLPNATYSVNGGGPYCAGTSGSDITLSSSDASIVYKLFNGGTLVNSMTGTGSLIDFGLHTAAGTYTALGVDPVTGCTSNMAGSATISVIPMLNLYTLSVSGGGHYCSGGTGNDVTLSGSEVGIEYDLYANGVYVMSLSGTGFPLVFPGQTIGGVYTVTAINTVTTCTRTMTSSTSITIDPLPAVYGVTVTGGGNYCAGGIGQHVGVALSNTGINYQLQLGGVGVGAPLGGTGSAIDFGLKTVSGNYTVNATNATTGCQSPMAGSVNINIIPLPVPYTLTGAGNYCVGGTGSDVQLSGSVTGVDYKLYKGSTMVNSMSGTGSMLDFMLNPVGTYTSIAVDATYGCTSNMTGTVIIGTNPLPTAFNVMGGGHYCSGGTGVHVNLSGSNSGISYQLYNTSGMIVGADSAGTGSAIDFGSKTLADVYTIVATNNSTTCTNSMTGSATVSIDMPVTPAVTISTAKDTVCAATMVTFSSSITNGGSGPLYQWKVNSTNMGTGSSFTYTPLNGDTVTTTLTSNATCVLPASVTSSPIYMGTNPGVHPTVSISTPNSTICATSTPVTFTASAVNPGTAPVYEWKKNGTIVGANSPTYSTVVADGDVVFAVLASNADCNLDPFVYAPPITMKVNTTVTPLFNITADPGTSVQKGQPVTFTAWVSNLALGTFKYQWSVNGSAISGATNSFYITSSLNTNDMVSCTVTSTSSCGPITGSHDLFMSVGTTGIISVSAINDVRVMPNPNKGAFTVKGSLATTDNQEVSLEVTNMLGQVVYSNKVMAQGGLLNEQVQLSNTLANGMYILNLHTGSETKAFHFVIEQ